MEKPLRKADREHSPEINHDEDGSAPEKRPDFYPSEPQLEIVTPTTPKYKVPEGTLVPNIGEYVDDAPPPGKRLPDPDSEENPNHGWLQ